jgi:hypothetical protein
MTMVRSGFITPSDARWRRCRPLEMLTYCRVCCAFESACALPSGVIRGRETTSSRSSHSSALPGSLRFSFFRSGVITYAACCRRCCIAFRINPTNASSVNGFRRKPAAPALKAFSSTPPSSWAVMKITGTSTPARVMRSWTSKPVIPGICTSITEQSTSSDRLRAERNSSPEANVRTCMPQECSNRLNAMTTEGSSSTIWISGGMFGKRSCFRARHQNDGS